MVKLRKLNALQSFKLIYTESCKFNFFDVGFTQCVIQNVIAFLQYIENQKKLGSDLQHIQILHETDRDRNYFPMTSHRSLVNKMKVNDVLESEKICKSLTSINSKHPNIKIIELYPVGIREEHLKFLRFWFSHPFGEMTAFQWRQKKKAYFIDLKITNN